MQYNAVHVIMKQNIFYSRENTVVQVQPPQKLPAKRYSIHNYMFWLVLIVLLHTHTHTHTQAFCLAASCKGHLQVAQLLVSRGANPKAIT